MTQRPIGEAYETANGEQVQDQITNMMDYHNLNETNKTLFDIVFKNSSVLLASQLYMPGTTPPPEIANRDEGMGAMLRALVETFGHYEMKDDHNYFVSIHPKLTQCLLPVFNFRLIEMRHGTTIIGEEDHKANIYLTFENVTDILNTHFHHDYDAMITDMVAHFGKTKASTTRMITARDYIESLASVVTARDVFFTVLFPIQQKGE